MSGDVDDLQRFKDIWMHCMLHEDHGEEPGGNLVVGPCGACVLKYARSGPPPKP